jgi:hypothetical protein
MKVVSKRESKAIKFVFTVILTIVSVLTCALIGFIIVTPIIDHLIKNH